jgi:hypothetical protein
MRLKQEDAMTMRRSFPTNATARRFQSACMLLVLAAVLGMLVRAVMDGSSASAVTELPGERIQWDAIKSNTEFASPAKLPNGARIATPRG